MPWEGGAAMLKKILDDLSGLLLALIICFSLVYAITSTLGLSIPVYFVLLAVVGLLAVYRVVFLSKLSRIISGLLVLIVLIYFAMQIAFSIGLTSVLEFLYDYFLWLYDLTVYGTYADILYSNITFIALCFIFTSYYFAFACRKFVFSLIFIPGAIVFSIQAIYNYLVTYLPFYVFLFALILCYLQRVHNRKAKNPGNEYLRNASFLLWIIPVSVLAVFAASLIHTSDKPIEWKWLDTKVNAVYNYFYKKFDYVEFDYFSVSASGFGEKNNLLGGRVRLNNTLVLSVEANKNVYLKGTSYDQYTGRNWVNTMGEQTPLEPINSRQYNNWYNNAPYFDSIETLLGMNILSGSPDYAEEYFYREKVKVIYQNIKSKSVFLPSKLIAFDPSVKDYKLLVNGNNTIVSEKRLGSGFAYELEYLLPKRSSEEFIDSLRKSKQGLYKEFSSRNRLASNQFLSLLEDNSEKIYAQYLGLPDTLPQRVYDLSSSLTVQYDNTYDKVKALEQYLSTNFPYNLDVRTTPRNRDFVDYFLFEQKEGYCTYFASALTIMARCIGIPARYVEGYILPPKASEKQSNLYNVTNNQAHAWTEVYFEGYGWLPFEATSPFRSGFYSDPEAAAVYSGNLASNPAYEDYMEMMQNYPQGTNVPSLDIGDYEVEKTPYLLYTVITAGAIIFLLASVLILNSVRTKMSIYRIMSMPPKESVLRLYKYFVSVLTYSGNGIQAGETPLQYSERIDRYFYFRPVKFREITDIFIKSRYSTREITDKEKQILIDFIPKLFAESKNDMGRARYFLYKRALGRF